MNPIRISYEPNETLRGTCTMTYRVASTYVNLFRYHKNGFKAAGISDALAKLLN